MVSMKSTTMIIAATTAANAGASDTASATSTTPPSLKSLDDVHGFWSKRWSGQKLGWHLEDVNPHLKKYANVLFGRQINDENSEDDAEVGENRIFVPLCGKAVDLAYLASHSNVSHVVGIDIVRNAAEEFAREHPQFSLQEVQFCDANSQDSGDCAADEEEKTTNDGKGAPTRMSSFHGEGISIVNGDLFQFLAMTSEDQTKYTQRNRNSFQEESKIQIDSSDKIHLFDAIYDRASMVAIKPTLRQEYASSMGKVLKPGGTMLLVTIERRKAVTEEAKADGPPFSIDETQVRELYESQPWVESVTLLEEVNDLETEEDRERWEKRGVLELYELVFVIKAKDV